MRKQFRIFVFPLIVLFILIGEIILFGINPGVFLCAMVPIKIYSNAEADKANILQENQKKKAGIYM
jgi:hypothetical protein